MKSAIVLGANGFIGSAVVKELLSKNYDVQALVHSKKLDFDNTNLTAQYFDFNSLDKTSETLEPADYLFNFAWSGSSGNQRSDVNLQLKNIEFINNSIKLSKKMGSKFIGAGSIMEYESIESVYKNGNRSDFNCIYGGAKYLSHVYSKVEAIKENIDYTWGMITNAYGPGENTPRLINNTLRKVLSNITPDFTSGTQLYDFVYIDDIAKAFISIAERGTPYSNYVLGSGRARPLRSFLEEINNTIAPNMNFNYGNIEYKGVSLTSDHYSTYDLEHDTGHKNTISFQCGIKNTYNWLKGELSNAKDEN